MITLSQGQEETEIAQNFGSLRHSHSLLSFLVHVEPAGQDETSENIHPIVDELSLQTISMQLETDCRDMRRRRRRHHYHQWILLLVLLGFILLGRVGVVTTCSWCMAGKELILWFCALYPPLQVKPAVTSDSISAALSNKSPVFGVTSFRLNVQDEDEDETTMMILPQHSYPRTKPNLHKIVFNTKNDSLGVWLR